MSARVNPLLGTKYRNQLSSLMVVMVLISSAIILLMGMPTDVCAQSAAMPKSIATTPYIGAGTMPIDQAIRFIEPQITKINFPQKFNTKTRVQWNSKGTVGSVFAELFRGLNLEWSLDGNTLNLYQTDVVATMESKPSVILEKDEKQASVTPVFAINSDDETLFLALRRWSTNAGYQLVWEAGKDFPARATTYKTSDLISAIELVMNDTANSNFPLHACVYDNKVIRILQISQGCGKTNLEDQK